MIALTKLLSWTHQGQRRRKKEKRKIEEERKWRNHFRAQTGILNLFVQSRKQKRKRGLTSDVSELIGLPVTVASLAYWQTSKTLVCIFHCFACKCTPARIEQDSISVQYFHYTRTNCLLIPNISFHLTPEPPYWVSHLCLIAKLVHLQRCVTGASNHIFFLSGMPLQKTALLKKNLTKTCLPRCLRKKGLLFHGWPVGGALNK